MAASLAEIQNSTKCRFFLCVPRLFMSWHAQFI